MGVLTTFGDFPTLLKEALSRCDESTTLQTLSEELNRCLEMAIVVAYIPLPPRMKWHADMDDMVYHQGHIYYCQTLLLGKEKELKVQFPLPELGNRISGLRIDEITCPFTGTFKMNRIKSTVDLVNPVSIFMTLFSGSTSVTYEMKTRLDDTVAEVKQRIEQDHKIPVQLQQLCFAGKTLSDSRPLLHYGIQKESKLYLIIRSRGGMMHVSSGRRDFCTTSDRNPYVKAGDSNVFAKQILVRHSKGDLRMFVYPTIELACLSRFIEMELDPDFFVTLSNEELSAIDAQLLSKHAMSRFGAAVLKSSQQASRRGPVLSTTSPSPRAEKEKE